MIKKLIAFFLFIVSAQMQAQGPEMADGLRASGKIYVVIAVIGIIFVALVALLIFLERKVKRLEDKLNTK